MFYDGLLFFKYEIFFFLLQADSDAVVPLRQRLGLVSPFKTTVLKQPAVTGGIELSGLRPGPSALGAAVLGQNTAVSQADENLNMLNDDDDVICIEDAKAIEQQQEELLHKVNSTGSQNKGLSYMTYLLSPFAPGS